MYAVSIILYISIGNHLFGESLAWMSTNSIRHETELQMLKYQMIPADEIGKLTQVAEPYRRGIDYMSCDRG